MKNHELPKLPELTEEQRAWYILQGYVIKENSYTRKFMCFNGKSYKGNGVIAYTHGLRVWYFNDKIHREDGPAIERTNSKGVWYLNGKEMSEEQHQIAIQKMRKERNNATS